MHMLLPFDDEENYDSDTSICVSSVECEDLHPLSPSFFSPSFLVQNVGAVLQQQVG